MHSIPKWIIWLALAAACCVPATASAQNGKTPPPPSPGTILFDNATWPAQHWGMKADGTGKKLAFLHQFISKPVPSALVYGTDPVLHRWWLTLEEVQVLGATHQVFEVFACRLDGLGSLQQVQLTALYPYVDFRLSSGAHSYLSWSNDGLDSFISVRGRSYGAQTAETPVNDLSDDRIHIFRMNLSGADIQAAFQSSIDPQLDLADLAGGTIESVLENGDDLTEWSLGYHDWSPDGTQLAYSTPWGLFVADCAGGPVTHGDASTRQIWTECRFPRWSPNGQRIALGHDGSVWTVNPDGSGAVRVLGAARNDRYAVPVWSPDSTLLAVVHSRAKGLDFEYFISRVPAAGGSVIVLTKDMNTASEKRPMSWPLKLTAAP